MASQFLVPSEGKHSLKGAPERTGFGGCLQEVVMDDCR